jgi:hypothetical protein
MTGLTLSLLFLASTAGAVAAGQPAPSSLSLADADALAQKIETLVGRARLPPETRAKQISVTEAEVNSFLGLRLSQRLPEGVSGLSVSFGKGRLEARALVDVERVQGGLEGSQSWAPLSLLSGNVPVELSGRIISDDGFATFEVQELRVASIPVPVSVLEKLVAVSTRTAQNPQGIDILSPFRLPYSLKRVRVRQGLASLEF